MKWSRNHDTIFVREILLFTPWEFKRSSAERGEVWANIAISLNGMESPLFKVTQRAVRDRYLLLEKKHKKKVSDENMASGISPEESEIDQAMGDIITRFEEADAETDRLSEEKKKKVEMEATKAAEMRRLSLETFKETQARNSEIGEPSRKKRRASGSDTMTYLKEKAEMDMKIKSEEMQLRKNEIAREREFKEEELRVRKLEQDERKEQNEQMFHQMLHSQTIQQQQMKQLCEMSSGMMLQQQQQSAAFMALLEKFVTK